MELYEEKKAVKKKDISKIIKNLLILTVTIILILVVLILVIPKPKVERPMSLTVDGVSKMLPEGLCILDGITGEPYFSIKDLADVLGYKYYRSEYIDRYTEDNTKCYVEAEQEVSSFLLGSKEIYKAKVGATGRYEYYNIGEAIRVDTDKLYSNLTGINIGFNVMAAYNKETKVISITTLPEYLKTVKTALKSGGTYTLDESDFNNNKATLYDLFVVKDNNNKIGVISNKGDVVIGHKYDKIVFSESTREFFVESEKKSGVLSLGGETKISLNYDSIEWLETDLRLYHVSKDKFHGVLDRNGKILVHIEYDAVGIDSKPFPKNKVKNNMFLYDNCIAVSKEKKWGFYDKEGKLIIPLVYDKVGCSISTTKEKSVNNVVLIEELDGIVVGITVEKAGTKYGLVNSVGEILIPCEYDKIYSITTGSEDIYYLEKDNVVISLGQYILEHNLEGYRNDNLVELDKNVVENTTDTTNTESDTGNVPSTGSGVGE